MRVAALTNHVSGYDALSGLDRSKANVDLILTTGDNFNKQKQISGAVSFDQLGIPLKFVESYNLQEDKNAFLNLNLDVLFVMGYQRLVPDEIINSVRLGAFGFHGSSEPLPKGRGRSPINWELIRGRRRFILFMFRLAPGADAGPIVDSYAFDMNEFDSIETVYFKVSLAMRAMIERTLPKLASGDPLPGTPQIGEATHFPKRTPEDGRIDWHQNTWAIYNFVRALTRPYPGAFTTLGGEQLMAWKAQPFSEFFFSDTPPGTVLEVFGNRAFLVKTLDSSLLITDFSGASVKRGITLGT